MNQYYDLDKGKNVLFLNDASSTSGYSSGNSPNSTTQSLSPAHSPETMALQTDFANLNLPAANHHTSRRWRTHHTSISC
nr:nuclear factor NF-kappa-B p110 subunit-like [Drosophila suzukii]